ncbi:MAG TPA: hypothetical protein VJU60_02495 [Thermoleophilaceae bacterium]|nr:hypothetical protein [Thermoleophilaceae bacterium]
MTNQIYSTPALDEETHVTGLLVGAGIVLTQAFAIFPGLLPCLLLALPFVLPPLILGVAIAIPVLLLRAAWRLLAAAAGRASQMLGGIRHTGEIETREAIPHGSITH